MAGLVPVRDYTATAPGWFAGLLPAAVRDETVIRAVTFSVSVVAPSRVGYHSRLSPRGEDSAAARQSRGCD